MDAWLKRSAIDSRFVDLAIFMSVLVWPWIVVSTAGLAIVAWKFVLMCQAIALPFSVLGWAYGFQLSEHLSWPRPARAMVAGWSGLFVAEAGLALVLWPWLGRGARLPGFWAFPALAVLVTVGVLRLYRGETWVREGSSTLGGNG